MDLSFYKNKAVLVTGHTGFKGSWLCKILINAGADVTGYVTTSMRWNHQQNQAYIKYAVYLNL